MQDNQAADKALDLLRDLAGVVGGTAEKLWPMAVEATWARGVTHLVCGTAGALVSIGVVCLVFRLTRNLHSDDKTTARAAFFFTGLIGGIISCITGLSMGLPMVLAPQGMTIFNLLGR